MQQSALHTSMTTRKSRHQSLNFRSNTTISHRRNPFESDPVAAAAELMRSERHIYLITRTKHREEDRDSDVRTLNQTKITRCLGISTANFFWSACIVPSMLSYWMHPIPRTWVSFRIARWVWKGLTRQIDASVLHRKCARSCPCSMITEMSSLKSSFMSTKEINYLVVRRRRRC